MSELSSKPADARTLAPPMPSRPGRRSEQHREVALALGPGEHEAVLGQQSEAEDVHERVVAVAVVEHDLAADGRDADRIPVSADSRHDALEQIAGACVVERAEAQRVHHRDRTGSHREHVADDPADARRRALIGLDRRRMIVALDADGDRQPVAHVEDPGALAGPDQDPGRLGREAAEMALRRLVGAVLGPHDGVHGELELGRRPPQQGDDVGQLGVGETEPAVQVGRELGRRLARRWARGFGEFGAHAGMPPATRNRQMNGGRNEDIRWDELGINL